MLLGLLAMNRGMQAQQVVAPQPTHSTPPQALQPYENKTMNVFVPGGASATETPGEPFHYKFLTLRPHLDYRFLYGDGILAAPGQPENTIIQAISPGFVLDVGNHWTLNYSPALTFYSNKRFKNTFDQSVSLNGGTAYQDWVLGLSQSYVYSSLPQAETATQTSQETYATGLKASYTINSKMSLDFGVNQNFVSADQFQSYREWSTLDWLNYQFWPWLNVALGVGLGYDNVDMSPDMLFQHYEGRINWRVTEKISLHLHGGLEDRQFLSGGSSDLINPILGGGIQYQPFKETKLSLDAERVVNVSFLQNQVAEGLSFSGDLNQRLLGRLFLDLKGGYTTTKYVASANTVSVNRSDDYYFFSTQISTSFLKRGTVAIFYQISDNSSTLSDYSFSSHQVGFEIGYRY